MNVMQCKSKKQKEKTKNQITKNNGHKGKNNEAQGPRKPRQIRDIESPQLLDEQSQTYFYQEVW